MHLYNAWLPPPVAAQTAGERDSFSRIIATVNSSFNRDDPESVYSTIRYISVLDLSVPFSTPNFQFPFSLS
jgi:proteasome activator subunit 4